MRPTLLAGASLAVFASMAAAAPASAQGQPAAAPGATTVSEIVVTAEKRTERLVDVPAAVTAIQGQTLQTIGAQNLADFAALVPGLEFSGQGNGGGSELVLRGIAVSGLQPSSLVGVVLDGVPVGSSSSYAQGGTAAIDSALWDISQVEVLRGPQGTLYGANAMGGLLTYTYNPPNLTRFGGALEAEGSDTDHGADSWAVRGEVNIPLATDQAALRISAYDEDEGGFIDDPTLGLKNINRDVTYGLRADLLVKPTDRLTIDLEGVFQHNHRDASDEESENFVTGQLVAGPYQNIANLLDPATFDYKEAALTIDYDLGPARLTSISSYERLENSQDLWLTDGSLGFLLANPALIGLTLPPAAAAIANLDDVTRKYNEEFRLTSTGQGPFKWLAGFYYTHETSSNEQNIAGFTSAGTPIPAAVFSLPSIFEEYAGFGQASYTLFSRLQLTAGFRYSHENQTFDDVNTGPLSILVPDTPITSAGTHEETYLFAARFALTADSNLYARASSGFRPGGPNVVIKNLQPDPTYGADSLWNYEAGYKATFLGGRADIDLDGYYISWNNIQALTSIDGLSEVANGGRASSRGVEAEASLRPIDGLTLGANVAYTDAHLDETAPLIGGVDGDPLPFSAHWSGAVHGDWRFPLTGPWSGFVGGTLRAVGQRDTSFPGAAAVGNPNVVLPSYVMGDLRAGVNEGRWTLTAFVDNVGDSRAQYSALTEESYVDDIAQVTIARPRTVGLRLDAGF